ncbi:hypothetical protein F2P44_29930 [Massilia sp. CCM 8695]|uniref:Haemolysin-type calcium binding-related domain-containing protein n=1 Tax=Massilia frigida TaxID=2609281 RepID=A0ABX0NEB8_9BURK|nr:hypothetical protein [Massilia frigida]
MQGQAGADKLFGMGGNDTLDGGAGNDVMDGGLGNDVYLFGRGDGRDIVYGSGVRPIGEINTLRFKPGVLPTDIGFDMSGTSLLININGTSDQFRVDGFLYGDTTSNTANPLQQIAFADGTTWNLAAITAALYAGTAGADTRNGTYLDDKISGLAGNDALSGKAGNDLLNGGSGDDWLSGDAGNDTLSGGVGSDTYLFGKGDGQDAISSGPDAQAGTFDTLAFKAGVLPSDLVLTATGGTLVVKINGSTDQMSVSGFVPQHTTNPLTSQLQRFLFADGSSWNQATINATLYAGTGADDTLEGGGGNDHIYGQAGNDWLIGWEGNDTLEGGAGSDYLHGGTGNDTFVYGRGDGEDVLTFTNGTDPIGFNTLQFKAGILPSDIVLKGAPPGMRIYALGTSNVDAITVPTFMSEDSTSNNNNPLQQITFADGTIWDISTILLKLFAGTETVDSI